MNARQLGADDGSMCGEDDNVSLSHHAASICAEYSGVGTRSTPSAISSGVSMNKRPARITQAEIERTIRAAKEAGAIEVEVKIGDEASVRIRLVLDESSEHVLTEARDARFVVQERIAKM